MSRMEDLKETLERVNNAFRLGYFEITEKYMIMMLGQIALSLAVIADKMMGEDK